MNAATGTARGRGLGLYESYVHIYCVQPLYRATAYTLHDTGNYDPPALWIAIRLRSDRTRLERCHIGPKLNSVNLQDMQQIRQLTS